MEQQSAHYLVFKIDIGKGLGLIVSGEHHRPAYRDLRLPARNHLTGCSLSVHLKEYYKNPLENAPSVFQYAFSNIQVLSCVQPTFDSLVLFLLSEGQGFIESVLRPLTSIRFRCL